MHDYEWILCVEETQLITVLNLILRMEKNNFKFGFSGKGRQSLHIYTL